MQYPSSMMLAITSLNLSFLICKIDHITYLIELL